MPTSVTPNSKSELNSMFNHSNILHYHSSPGELDSEENSSATYQVPNMKIINEAVKYLDQVKYKCEHNPELYQQFFEYMTEHKCKKLTSSAVITHVSQLFHDQPELIIGFNAFVPPGYEINIENYSINDLPYTSFNSDLINDHLMDSDNETTPVSTDNEDRLSNYINNIQTRYHDEPEVYQKFLKYLFKYNKEFKVLSVSEEPDSEIKINKLRFIIYAKISKLFEDDADLLSEFEERMNTNELNCDNLEDLENNISIPKKAVLGKRKLSDNSSYKPKKRRSSISAGSIADGAKFGGLSDFRFFDDVKKALQMPAVYDNFLRCITLYNDNIADADELIMLVRPFLGRFPELYSYFQKWLNSAGSLDLLSLRNNVIQIARDQQRVGESYLPLPEANRQKCSGRTSLCLDVLNDTFVSFPTSIEESTSLTAKKTLYEERIMRVEDERYELDVAIESNLSTIETLESVKSSIDKMSSAEVESYRLDDRLGGCSETIHRRSIKRIYGEQVGNEMIETLKNNPISVLLTIIQKLKAKDIEWKKEQRKLNKHWATECQKYYWKALDHQFLTFKQNDVKNLKSKILINEIEANLGRLEFTYEDSAILEDGAHLIMHQVKRQFGIHRQDKTRIRKLLSHFLSSLFFQSKQFLSDDEESETNDENNESNCSRNSRSSRHTQKKEHSYHLTEPNEENYKLFFCNDNWYLFLRLYSVICERLNVLHTESLRMIEEESQSLARHRHSLSLAIKKPKSEDEIEDYYQTLIGLTTRLLDGYIEHDAYEEKLHGLFGVKAYIAFTLDKVIAGAARQLHYCVFEKPPSECMEIFLMERMYGGAGGPCKSAHLRHIAELRYQKKIEKLLKQENCYKIIIYKMRHHFSIELMQVEEQHLPDMKQAAIWSSYVEKFAQFHVNDVDGTVSGESIFLRRNLKYMGLKNDVINKACVIAKLVNIFKTENRRDSEKDSLVTNVAAVEDCNNEINMRINTKNVDSNIVIRNSEEYQLKQSRFKIFHIGNKPDFVFREKSCKAREHVDNISFRKRKFKLFMKEWTKKNVSEYQNKTFEQWLKRTLNE